MDTPADASGIPASRVGQVSFLELAQGQGVTGGRRCCIFFERVEGSAIFQC